MFFRGSLYIKMINISLVLWPDDNKDHKDDIDEKLHAFGFDEAAENMIKKVKHALESGEGCRVLSIIHFQSFLRLKTNPSLLIALEGTKSKYISFILYAGLWSFGCATCCWKLSYISPWIEHLCCTNGK